MTIYIADPPWRYSFSKSKSRDIENQYPTMTMGEIEELDFEFQNDSALYLWATAPKLVGCLGVMGAWGFRYRSCMVWDKEIMGMGYWARGQHEMILIGVKGLHSPPEPSLRRSSVIRRKRTKHSAKPADLHEYIEASFPDEERVELFAREKRPGWICCGDEIGSRL